MILEKGLQEFLNEAIGEKLVCTVEGRLSRMLSQEEINYINAKLRQRGYEVNCFRCDTCEEYSNGKEPFHIERKIARYY